MQARTRIVPVSSRGLHEEFTDGFIGELEAF
jgi:hypothetical protein